MELKVNNLSLKKGSGYILQNINMQINDKEFVAIIGPNGGGKTTLLKSILGVIKPTEGEVLFNGTRITKEQISSIGYVPQIHYSTPLFPISVFEVVMMGRLRFKKSWHYTKEDQKIAAKSLEHVGLYDFKKRVVNELSGGEKQRVFIARALATEPSILMMDEPTSNIDSVFESRFLSMLKDLVVKMPIVMVTHDVGVVSSLVNRVFCLNVRLFSHDSSELSADALDNAYHCPVELISHGEVPHRILKSHKGHHHE